MTEFLSITDVFSMIHSIYLKIVQSGSVLWAFFSSKIDPQIAEFFDIPLDTLYIELLFGSLLAIVLVGSVLKWFLPI